jgi:anti-anti-sigma factor
MQIDIQKQAAVTVISPKGPLLGLDVASLRDSLDEAFRDSLGRVVLDLSRVTYTDSKGLEMIHKLGTDLVDIGRVFRLAGTNETMREVLAITEVGALCEQFDDIGSAVRSFS